MKPIKFIPQYKHVIWGGCEIASFKGEDLPGTDIGESWEISGLEGHESIVADGPDAGTSIGDMIRRYGLEMMGEAALLRYGYRFPLILKILDANRDLSLQVHPDDDEAHRLGLPNGKTEMWYVVKSAPGAKIHAGFSAPLTHGELNRHIERKTVMECINTYDSHPGDSFYLPAGCVHALGAGNLLIEIQQASDMTYRIYDYDRRDASGQPRQLHVEEAARSLSFDHTQISLLTPSQLTAEGDLVLCRSPYFTTMQVRVNGRRSLTNPTDSFMLLFVTEGEIEVTAADFKTVITQGHTLFIPADCPAVTLTGTANLLVFTL